MIHLETEAIAKEPKKTWSHQVLLVKMGKYLQQHGQHGRANHRHVHGRERARGMAHGLTADQRNPDKHGQQADMHHTLQSQMQKAELKTKPHVLPQVR